jgi:hypothetical protein
VAAAVVAEAVVADAVVAEAVVAAAVVADAVVWPSIIFIRHTLEIFFPHNIQKIRAPNKSHQIFVLILVNKFSIDLFKLYIGIWKKWYIVNKYIITPSYNVHSKYGSSCSKSQVIQQLFP